MKRRGYLILLSRDPEPGWRRPSVGRGMKTLVSRLTRNLAIGKLTNNFATRNYHREKTMPRTSNLIRPTLFSNQTEVSRTVRATRTIALIIFKLVARTAYT